MAFGPNGEGIEDEDDEDGEPFEDLDEDEEDPDLEIIDHDKENSNGQGDLHKKDGQVSSTPLKVERPVRNIRLNFSKVLYHSTLYIPLLVTLFDSGHLVMH